MPAKLTDAALDKTLDYLATCDLLTACSAEPTTFTEMNATFKLADAALTGGDWTKANGDVDGRKITRAAKNGVVVDTSGTATYLGYGIVAGSVFVASVPLAASVVLTAAGTVDFNAHKFTVRDPA